MGGIIRSNLSHFRCLACWVVEFNNITSVPLIQVGNNRNVRPFQVLFRCRCPLNRGVHLIKASFKENKGNEFGDFGYCPLNRGCPLNTGFTVPGGLLTVYPLHPLIRFSEGLNRARAWGLYL